MLEFLSLFLDVLAPVFLLVIIGYWSGPRLRLEARSLSKVAYYILTPAFIFNIFAEATIEPLLALRMAAFIVLVALGCVATGLTIAYLLRLPAEMVAAFVLIAAFGNVGNFGLPIIQFKLGDTALVPASFYFLTLSAFGFIVGVAAATWQRGNPFQAAKAVLTTPAILAVFPAIAVNLLNLPLPLFVGRGVQLLAAAMIPVMLLVLGVQLAAMSRPAIDHNVILASMIRLGFGPLLAFALAAPFGLTDGERGAGILQSSMPTAVLAVLVALEHKLLPEFVTTAVLFSTIASAFTLTIVLALV